MILRQDFNLSVRSNEDKKLIMYLGEGGSLIKYTNDKAFYIGGISVNPNKHVLNFENTK